MADWYYWIPSNMEMSTTSLYWNKHGVPIRDMHFMSTTLCQYQNLWTYKWLSYGLVFHSKLLLSRNLLSIKISITIGSCLWNSLVLLHHLEDSPMRDQQKSIIAYWRFNYSTSWERTLWKWYLYLYGWSIYTE